MGGNTIIIPNPVNSSVNVGSSLDILAGLKIVGVIGSGGFALTKVIAAVPARQRAPVAMVGITAASLTTIACEMTKQVKIAQNNNRLIEGGSTLSNNTTNNSVPNNTTNNLASNNLSNDSVIDNNYESLSNLSVQTSSFMNSAGEDFIN